MKKAIILLSTIFFITIISLLIITNLKQTDEYINKTTKDLDFTQAEILIKNISKELANHENLNEFSKNLDEDEYKQLPFKIKNIDINVALKLASKNSVNLNFLIDSFNTNKMDLYYKVKQKLDFLFIKFNIENSFYIEQSIFKNSKYNSYKQVQSVINNFYEKYHDKNIFKIKDYLSYKPIDNNFLFCNINIKQNKSQIYSKILIDIKNKKADLLEFTIK
ncbi:hypothetical protein [Arcobacter sp. CECT 8985]|uniref:hypothetical protein n=1 Tax=Arcobacter sp. CECT 8985 TaxID=1935424 RepID=UPI00100C1C6E|nr:hypothetical protein [Arcobacter sp. CECT 8985]RXJ86035.1 hypothetical protein CRU93_10260 [Arcobacter sp. CECT 8985]